MTALKWDAFIRLYKALENRDVIFDGTPSRQIAQGDLADTSQKPVARQIANSQN